MKKLIIYGDSILRGITYSDEMQRHKLCSGHKMESLSKLGYEVINRSRMGATVVRGLQILESTIEECDADSVVLLEYGGNDCDYDWEPIATDPDATHLPHTPADRFIDLYADAIKRLREKGARVVLATLVPPDADRYMKWITKDRSYDNILRWLGDTSMLYRFHEYYNRLVEDLSRQFACPLIDLRSQFLLSHSYKHLISNDGMHPTEQGHDLIESTIYRYLKTQCATA